MTSVVPPDLRSAAQGSWPAGHNIRPGHDAHIDDDTEFVEFNRADQVPGINTVAL